MHTKSEHTIAAEFPGPHNRGMRQLLRNWTAFGDVMSVARHVALTGHRGLPSLKAVQHAVDHDIKLTDIRTATVNGQRRKAFKAWALTDGTWIFAGEHTAPPRATIARMIHIAECNVAPIQRLVD